MSQDRSTADYSCPGEDYTISRAVHLARLADFYPACRKCPRRGDTAGLSARQIRRLAEVETHPPERTPIEEILDMDVNAMRPADARALAAEFACRVESSSHRDGACNFVFSCDGRLSTAPLVAAVVEGLRWSGCETIDLGPASMPCMAHAVAQLGAAGGIYLGKPGDAAHTFGMKFWADGKPFSLLPATKETGRKSAGGLDRPTRTFGPLRRWNAADDYLNVLRPAYHGLRPLRFVLRCTCAPVISYLEDLMQNVACRIVPAEPGGVGTQVVAAKAHFGIEVTDDGEKARIFDERGEVVAAERLPFVVPPSGGPRGEEVTPASYRLKPELQTAKDALLTLTALLALLSRDDLPLSAVLDRRGNAS